MTIARRPAGAGNGVARRSGGDEPSTARSTGSSTRQSPPVVRHASVGNQPYIQADFDDYLPQLRTEAQRDVDASRAGLAQTTAQKEQLVATRKATKGRMTTEEADASGVINSITANLRRWEKAGGGDHVLGRLEELKQGARPVYDQATQALTTTGKGKMYLGRLDDTRPVKEAKKQAGKGADARVLDSDVWSLGINDAFMGGGIDLKARFKFKTDLTSEAKTLIMRGLSGQQFLLALQADPNTTIDRNLFDPNSKYQLTVTAREIAQLLDKGYVFGSAPAANSKKPDSFQAFPDAKSKADYIADKKAERR